MSNKIEVSFEDQIENKTDRYLLAVSGGRDSMCLWYLFRKYNIPHAVAHLNYGLRASESDADQELIERIAKEQKIDCFIKKVKINKSSSKAGGIQEEARNLRYQWFDQLKVEHTFDKLATAHHLDDSVETFLININRGAGLNGLRGIRSTAEVFRPLLPHSREEITAYVKENKIDFRDDVTNEQSDYLRNWFRNELIPKWKERNPDFIQSATRSISNLQEADSVLNYLLDKEIKGRFGNIELPLKIHLREIEAEVRSELLYRMAKPFGFNREQLFNIQLAFEAKNNSAIVCSSQYQLVVDRDNLILSDIQLKEFDAIEISEEGIDIYEPYNISIDVVDISTADLNKDRTEYLDYDKLSFPLSLRKWKEGDRMQPLGMQGRKKISDILIDEKYSVLEKDEAVVLQSGDEIVYLLHWRISEKYKVNKNSQKLLRIQW